MIAGLKPYPRYTNSGVDEVGEVPVGWDAVRLGEVGRFLKGSGGSKEDEVPAGVPCIRYGDLYSFHRFHIDVSRSFVTEERSDDYLSIKTGDVLFAASGETLEEIGKSAANRMTTDVCAGGDIIVLRPIAGLDPTFMGYACDSPLSVSQKSRMGKGVTVMHIYPHAVRNLKLPLPPVGEQVEIGRFLDRLCELIDESIDRMKEQIELLEEEKQAVIHRAVTRGLDPSVQLKPSGVGWLGDVPEHWEVRRIRSLTRVRRGASPRPIDDPKYFSDDGSHGWVRIADVTASNRYLTRTSQYLSDLGRSKSVALEPGSLFLSIAGSVGKPIITEINCCIHDGFVYFPDLRNDPLFLFFVFETGAPYAGLGKMGTQLNLNTDTVGGIKVALPPQGERRAIVSFIESQSKELDKAKMGAERQIELLDELRTRLISDVVTGKLDVREAAARLPADPDDGDEALEEAIEEAVT